MVCTPTRRSGHDDDVTRTQQDWNRRDVARKTADQEDRSVSKANGPPISRDDGKKVGLRYRDEG
jgi:hypothetical protein